MQGCKRHAGTVSVNLQELFPLRNESLMKTCYQLQWKQRDRIIMFACHVGLSSNVVVLRFWILYQYKFSQKAMLTCNKIMYSFIGINLSTWQGTTKFLHVNSFSVSELQVDFCVGLLTTVECKGCIIQCLTHSKCSYALGFIHGHTVKVKRPAPVLDHPKFYSRPESRMTWRIIVGLLIPLRGVRGQRQKLVDNRFLPHPS